MKETLSYQILSLYRDFLGYTRKEFDAIGLSFGQMPLILYVGTHPGCTHADLTKALQLDWGYSQRTVAKLSENGFLSKQRRPDRSGSSLTLTKAGENAFGICHGVFSSWDTTHSGNMTQEEAHTLLILLQKLAAEPEES